MELTCPKCHGAMRSYERNGVHVDQCTECRGIFLDRGELERLMDAENSWHESAPTPGGSRGTHQPQAREQTQGQGSLGALVGEVLQQARQQQGSHGNQQHRGYGDQQRYSSRKKKSSFLGELFG